MRYLVELTVACVMTVTSAAAEPPVLEKPEVLRIAVDYAHRKKWDVINVWEGVVFDDRSREWRVFIQTKQNGGPMIVYVSDQTKKVRFARGE